MPRLKLKPITVLCQYACYVIATEWRDHQTRAKEWAKLAPPAR